MFQLVKNINRAQRSDPKVFTFLLKKCSLEWIAFKNDNRSEEAVSKSVCTASGGWVFESLFHSYGDVTMTDEALQILTYARHLLPLSGEGFLACNTYCDTGRLSIMVISEDQWHSHLLPSCWQWSCHYLFLRLRSVAASLDIQILMITSNFHLYIGHICMYAVRMSVCL